MGGHLSTPQRSELPGLVDEGLRMVRHRRQASPGFAVYQSIERQLEYLAGVIRSGGPLPEDRRANLTLGVYAAREFEASDPEFADVLFKVNYLANRME